MWLQSPGESVWREQGDSFGWITCIAVSHRERKGDREGMAWEAGENQEVVLSQEPEEESVKEEAGTKLTNAAGH